VGNWAALPSWRQTLHRHLAKAGLDDRVLEFENVP